MRGVLCSLVALACLLEAQVTAEVAESISWEARGALQRRQYDKADADAGRAYRLAQELLKKQTVDSDPHLAIALGAAIEVHAQVLAARGERDQAVLYLREQLQRYGATSINARIQKNINLLSLEGKPAPALNVGQWLGPKPASLAALHGKPVLLFFWAHWCADCKAEAPVLERLKSEYGSKIAMVAPTQLYGYMSGGEEAPPSAELQYIGQVRAKYYAGLSDVPAPVSADNFKRYGASTTPTLVLIDRAGMVRLYHPGNLTYEQLKSDLDRLLAFQAHAIPRMRSSARETFPSCSGSDALCSISGEMTPL
jgi:thiol-disulfide isomerase/thioredoxin